VRADALFGAGDRTGALRAAERAVQLAESAGMPEAQCEALAVIGQCLMTTDVIAARAAWDCAVAVAAARGMTGSWIRARISSALTRAVGGESMSLLVPMHDDALAAGLLAQAASIDVLCADDLGCESGPRVGLPLAKRAFEVATQLRLTQLRTVAALSAADLLAQLGLENAAQRFAALAGDGDLGSESAALQNAVDGILALGRGDLAEAWEQLDLVTSALAELPTAAPLKYWGLWAVLSAAQRRWDDAARHRYLGSSAAFRQVNTAGYEIAEAIGEWRNGRPERAAARYAEATRIGGIRRSWLDVLDAVAMHAAVSEGWGEPVPELRRLVAAFEEVGADGLARTCRDQLRRAGAPVPRRGRGAGAVPPQLAALGVTSRELDVLTQIRAGHTNGEIADQLFLSRRTVETHVANLLTKTGAAGRAQLPKRVEQLIR